MRQGNIITSVIRQSPPHIISNAQREENYTNQACPGENGIAEPWSQDPVGGNFYNHYCRTGEKGNKN